MKKEIKHDQELIKKMNKRMVLNLIKVNKLISRAQLSKLSKMSATSIGRIITELTEQGFVRETGQTSTGIGRQAVLLEINPDALYCVGVEIDRNILQAAMFDFAANKVAELQKVSVGTHADPEKTADTICAMIRALVQKQNIQESEVVAIGIGLPGVINSDEGISSFSPQMGWKNVRFKQLIEERINIPTFMDNDQKVKALAEFYYGSARHSSSTLFIGIGSGVGSVLMLNGNVFRGGSNSAGEIGHTTIDPNGILCECGRRGCLQTYIAEWALIQEANKIRPISGIEELFEASKTEGWAMSIINRAAMYCGMMVSNAVCMYNPDTIILGGTMIERFPELTSMIEEQCKQFIWEPYKDTFKICRTELKGSAVVIGAGTLASIKYMELQ